MSTLDTSVRRDEQRTPVLWGLSSTDGTTLVQVKIDAATGALMVESGLTTMAVMSNIPKTLPRDGNRRPCMAGVSNAAAGVFIPVSVNPTTGALQTQEP